MKDSAVEDLRIGLVPWTVLTRQGVVSFAETCLGEDECLVKLAPERNAEHQMCVCVLSRTCPADSSASPLSMLYFPEYVRMK